MLPGNELTDSSELIVEWFDGEFYPPEEVRALFSVEEYPAESAILIGTEGALLIPHTQMPLLLPQDKFQGVEFPQLEARDHYHHFVDACLGGEMTASHFSVAGPMTEAIILGTVAILEAGKTLHWDPIRMRFPNHPEAEVHLRRRYRKGWRKGGF